MTTRSIEAACNVRHPRDAIVKVQIELGHQLSLPEKFNVHSVISEQQLKVSGGVTLNFNAARPLLGSATPSQDDRRIVRYQINGCRISRRSSKSPIANSHRACSSAPASLPPTN